MKTTAIVGVTAAAIGFLVGTQLERAPVSTPVSITMFKIKVPFNQWASGFDSKEAGKMHKKYEIKPLFRGVSDDDPKRVIVIHRSRPGAVEKLLSENQKMIESAGHIIRTTRISNWSFGKN